MNNKKQKQLLQILVSSPDTFALCMGILKSSYFDPEYRKVVSLLLHYYDEYNSLPDCDTIEAETDVRLDRQEITKDKVEYCADQIGEFCKQKAIESAIIKSSELLDSKDYGKIEQLVKDAVTLSLTSNLGVEYFDDPELRIEESLKGEAVTPTGWDQIDKLLYGGIARKWLVVFAANSGGGKSMAMANLCVNMMKQKKTCLYISLELSESMVSKRFDSMFTGISQSEWQYKSNDIVNTLETIKSEYGALHIKYMPPETKTNEIKAYLKEFELTHGYVPDVIAVDYLDLMAPNQHVSSDNVFLKDKLVSEQLRGIANEYNTFMLTASQLNRSAVEAEHHTHANIAGGISKINTADVVVSIMWTDTMRAANEIAFQLLKTRSSDGVGKVTYLKWVPAALRMINSDRQQNAQNNEVSVVAPESQKNVSQKAKLLSLLED
jgi:replicative DNA helicase